MRPWPWEVCHCGLGNPLVCREGGGDVSIWGPFRPQGRGLCERWCDSDLVLQLQAQPATRRAWAPRRGQEAEGKEQGRCGSRTEPVLCARPGFVIFTSRLREAVTCAWSQPALGSVCPGLSAGSTTGKLRDHGQVISPLCALLSSSVKGSSDPEVMGCSEVIHINSLAQVSGGTN